MGKGRAPCCDKNEVKRGPWSPEEDLKLITFIQKHGHDNWRSLPKQAGLIRCGKSCRLRWINYLRPDVKRGNFTDDEVESIIQLHRAFGNKWSKIASHLPGRTDNEIKNVWNTTLKKRLLKTSNHKPTHHHQSKQKSFITSSSSSSPRTSSNESISIKTNDEQNFENDQDLVIMASPSNNDEPIDDSNDSSVLEIEVPFETNYDFWNMFLDDDDMGGSFKSNDQLPQHYSSNLEEPKLDSETKKWFIEMEKELGLLEPHEAFDLEMMMMINNTTFEMDK